MILFFIKLGKLYFSPILGHFGQKTPEQDFFSKTLAPLLFKLDNTLTSSGKTKNFLLPN